MNYLYNFLVKVVIRIMLTMATFNVWQNEAGTPGILSWFLPLIATFWLVLTIVNGIQNQRKKRWMEDIEEDERESIINYKVGYIAFWCNMGFLALLFFLFGTLGAQLINPVYALVSVVLLNILIYYGTKLYILFFK